MGSTDPRAPKPDRMSAATGSPPRAALDRKAAEHLRRMGIYLLAALCMPVVLGAVAAVASVLFNLGWKGMDSYVPLFLGGGAGCGIGACFLFGSGLEYVRATRCRRQADALAD